MPILNSHSVIYSRVKPPSPYPVKAIPLCKERAQGQWVRRGGHALLWPSWGGGSASPFSRRYLCLLCEKPLEWSPTVITGMCLFFFTADGKSREYVAKEQTENADRMHQCTRKKNMLKIKAYYQFILNEKSLSYLYHHNPTYLTCVRTDALPIRFSPSSVILRSQRVFPVTRCPWPSTYAQEAFLSFSFAFSSLFLPGNPEKSSESHLKSGLRNILSKYSEAHTLLQLQDTVCAEGWI